MLGFLRSTLRFLGLLALAGATYQALATAIDRRRFPPPGRLIDVGGHRLHIDCAGDGRPTVVVSAAGAGSPLDWGQVKDAVAGFTRICVHDRAGSGWSDSGPPPRTSARVAGELHTLLRNAGIEPPYVLVGHSISGLHMRQYIAQYPDEIAGLVLVDSSHEDQLERLPEQNRNEMAAQVRLLGVARMLAPFGIVRLAVALGLVNALSAFQGLAPRARAAARAVTNWTDLATIRNEIALLDESTSQVRAARRSLGDMPVAVLTAGVNRIYEQEGMKEPWFEMQRDLATLSSNSRHVIAEKSTHYIHNDEPELVIDAIRWAVEQARR